MREIVTEARQTEVRQLTAQDVVMASTNEDGSLRRVLRPPLHSLTSTRFFAAFYVMLYHFASRPAYRAGAPALLVRFLSNGHMGVPFFFILSGFILSYSYLGQLRFGKERRRFWEARFSRVYPVYLLSLLIDWPFRGQITVGAQLAILTATQTWNPAKGYLAQAWNFPAWTLSVEAFFYLSFPLLLPICAKLRRRSQIACIGLLCAVVVLLHTSIPLDRLGPIDASILHWIPLPIVRLPEFVLGIFVALRLIDSPKKGNPLRIALYLLVALVMLSVLDSPWLSLITLPYLGLIYELGADKSWFTKALSWRPLVFLGGASYSIYLLQYPIRNWVRFLCEKSLRAPYIVGSLLSPPLLICVACLVFHLYEEPMRRILKRVFSALEFHRQTLRQAWPWI
jgi:peptidoglycan/LPS O-acetylase OafA/YrhL